VGGGRVAMFSDEDNLPGGLGRCQAIHQLLAMTMTASKQQ